MQYSTAMDDQERAQSHLNKRYAGAAATYQNGDLALVFVVDTVKHKGVGTEDEKSVSVGANYDFGYLQPFVGVQTTRHGQFTGRLLGRDTNDLAVDYKMVDASGYAITAGTKVDLRCGRLQVTANYGSAEDTADQDMKLYSIGMMHQYPLSARTTFYSGLGFQKATLDLVDGTDRTTRSYEVMAGLKHSF